MKIKFSPWSFLEGMSVAVFLSSAAANDQGGISMAIILQLLTIGSLLLEIYKEVR